MDDDDFNEDVDGKQRFIVDKSLGGRNHEYVHPDHAKQDAEALEPYLSHRVNWRDTNV